MSKKNILIFFLVLIVLIQSIGIYSLLKVIGDRDVEVSNNNSKTYKNLAIMYETDEDSGEYVPLEDNDWPSEGYKYNETLSKCENGSTMTYDEPNNKVNVTSNVSDKCYVYFDRYIQEPFFCFCNLLP